MGLAQTFFIIQHVNNMVYSFVIFYLTTHYIKENNKIAHNINGCLTQQKLQIQNSSMINLSYNLV